MKQGLKIAIGADHAGFDYKQALQEVLPAEGLKDFGTYSDSSPIIPTLRTP